MPSKSNLYIAGVGFSPASSKSPSADAVTASLVSAGTKALLDAGITIDDVSHGVRSKRLTSAGNAFKAFDEEGFEIKQVEDGSEIQSASKLVTEQGATCVLILSSQSSGSIALVLISELFFWRHAYLQDSAVLIAQSKSSGKSGQDLYEACQIVWRLRGWSESKSGSKPQYTEKSTTFDFSRADGANVPKWKEVEHKQDGKHRLRYNPAAETKEISQEDLEAVRAEGKKHKDQNWTRFDRVGGDRAALAKL